MKQYTVKQFKKILKDNGYSYDRTKGDHEVYIKENKNPISIPVVRMKSVVALRLIKENSLVER